jgi:hypothetical protein
MAELFGFKFGRTTDTKSQEKFTVPPAEDGAVEIAGGGFFGQVLDTDGRERSEVDLIRRYREVSQQPECDSAIEDIVNEAIVSNEKDQAVSIELDRLDYPKSIKNKIRAEFDHILTLLDFDVKGHDIFRRWYIDGRIFYHKVIDKDNPKKGIVEVRYIDPRKIRKVRETKKTQKGSFEMIQKVDDYFLYNEKGLNSGALAEGIKIAGDSITYVPSGLIDMNRGHVLGHLHKAIKPVNQLRMIEDSVVIYRISRAPERRIFYIDVGNLPKVKAEQYLRDVMSRYRNKLVYDANTGEIKDDKKFMSMLEDFWLPRREGGRGTEITTLPGGQNLGELTDVEYFQKKLYRSLNVPESRIGADGGFNLGRSSEILRDELMFSKFVGRLRKRFSGIFLDLLKTQLILKNIVTPQDWNKMAEHIQFDYLYDNHFAELKDTELMNERLNLMTQIEPYIGTYYSRDYVKRKILRQTEEEMIEMEKEMEEENATGVGVPLETQQAIAQGQMEVDRATTNLGKNGKDPDTKGNSTESPGIDIKKVKI